MQEILFETELNVIQEYENLLDSCYPAKQDKYDALNLIDWDFKNFQTQYLTHRFHSYPTRFIPQIPKAFVKNPAVSAAGFFTKEKNTLLLFSSCEEVFEFFFKRFCYLISVYECKFFKELFLLLG